ncbi:hypothetical protein D3C75_779650 [compost metagenome]
MLSRTLRKRLIGPLHNTLSAYINPAAGRHLPVHHQPLLIQLVKGVPVRPGRNQVGIRDENPRGIRMRAENGHRLAGLNEQGLVVFQCLQRTYNGVEALPIPCCLADSPIDDQLPGMLRHLRIEIVHQHT